MTNSLDYADAVGLAQIEKRDEQDTITLTRFKPIRHYAEGLGEQTGVFVDVETTGLDPVNDKIIQLALLPFSFRTSGESPEIVEVGEPFVRYDDPGIPIPPEITKLTGITDEMVAGQRINGLDVESRVKDAAIVVAHHAEFDRQFTEKRFPIFQSLRWGCSRVDIKWADEGYPSFTKLEWLAFKHCGMFYDNHRADLDCAMGVHMLASTMPVTGATGLGYVLAGARRHYYRIWACGAPFETRHILKARHYTWSDGAKQPKSWYIDVAEQDYFSEREWLDENVYNGDSRPVVALKYDARKRFSSRILP